MNKISSGYVRAVDVEGWLEWPWPAKSLWRHKVLGNSFIQKMLRKRNRLVRDSV